MRIPLAALILAASLCAAVQAEPPEGSGHRLKPEPRMRMTMIVHDDRLEFVQRGYSSPGSGVPPSKKYLFDINRSEVKGLEYQAGDRRASIGSFVAWGVMGGFAKRTMTTIGIEKHDGEIFVFRMKGKDKIDVLMALDRFMGQEAAEDTPMLGGAILRCDQGHEWPLDPDFRFCPKDGLPLREIAASNDG